MTAVVQLAGGSTTARTFLNELYEHTSEGWVHAFSLDRASGNRRTDWAPVDDLDLLINNVRGRVPSSCIWFGPAPRARNLGGLRGGAPDCISIPALWVDIDVAGERHKATDLPPDLAAGRQLIGRYPAPPTAIVETGGGLQAWWFLDEPLPADQATDLLVRWGATWAAFGAENDWRVDNVFDLARVMRLPGTKNHKTNPVDVTITDWHPERRYTVDELDQWTVDPPAPPTPNPARNLPYIGPERPGDAFNASVDPAVIWTRHGFILDHTDPNGDRHYRAPHRTNDRGATGLTVYTDGHSTLWSETFATASRMTVKRPYDAFAVYTWLEHGGDWRTASDALARQGYGTVSVPLSQLFAGNPATTTVAHGRNLPDEFWTARLAHQHIRQAAHSRSRSADAVLLFTLARTAALINPTVRLPAVVGGQASLNFMGAVVGPSGSGKTSSGAVARELVPIDRPTIAADLPLGSGEGLVEMYFDYEFVEGPDGKKVRQKRQVKKSAYVYLDEGQALAEMGNRKGATLLPTLRNAWSGDTLGQSNASAETRRTIPPHQYRLALVTGFQPEHAGALIADAAGGTPQRFVFAAATDPTIPDDAPEWPGELAVEMCTEYVYGRQIEVHPDIVAEIRLRDRQKNRGEIDPHPLDAHRDLVKLKTAALLAYLDGGRHSVHLDDWELAEMVMVASGAVRAWVIEVGRHEQRQAEQGAIRRAINRQAAIEDDTTNRALAGGAAAIGRKVAKAGSATKRDLHAAVASQHRAIVSLDRMIEHAESEGWIVASGAVWLPGESRPA